MFRLSIDKIETREERDGPPEGRGGGGADGARGRYLHEGGECIRVLSLDLLHGAVSSLLAATREDDVVAALAQAARQLVAEAGVRTRHYDHASRHRVAAASLCNRRTRRSYTDAQICFLPKNPFSHGF